MGKISIAQTVTFILGTMAVPLLLIAINFVIRWLRRWYYTSGSDALYFLLAMNFSLAILTADVAPIIRNEDIREALTGIYITLALLTFICWLFVVHYVENYINKAIRTGVGRKGIAIKRSLFSWAFVLVFLTLNIGIIFYP